MRTLMKLKKWFDICWGSSWLFFSPFLSFFFNNNRMPLKRARRFLFMCLQKLQLMRLRKLVWHNMEVKLSCQNVCVFFSCPLLAMKKIQLLLTRFYLTFTFTNDVFASPNRSWTLAAGCEGHNHQHTCNWGFCFLTDFLCLIIELSSSF